MTDGRDPPGDADDVFRIWPGSGVPAESADWDRREQIGPGNPHTRFVRNVTIPTLTVFRPRKPTGASVLILPGGAFHFLAIDHEGYDVARWLARLGLTAFVLKYRVQATPESDAEMPGFLERLGDGLPKVTRRAVDPPTGYPPAEEARAWAEADARQAMAFLRGSATALGIDPARIGAMGFSAGGSVVNAALSDNPQQRPDFIGAIYPAWRPPLAPGADAPPIFIAMGDADEAVAPISAAKLYEAWHAAGAPAELHIYARSPHGFGLAPHGTPSDAWPRDFEAWLRHLNLI